MKNGIRAKNVADAASAERLGEKSTSKLYRHPELKEYGSMKNLTLSGDPNEQDDGGGYGDNQGPLS